MRRLFAVILLISLVAAACGNSGDDDGGTDSATSDDSSADGTAPPATETGSGTEPATSAPDSTTDTDGETDGSAPSERDTFVAIEGVPGVNDTEIRYASIATKENNPLGTCIMDCYNQGIEAYFAWRNSEGGIYGREMVLADKIDDELSNNQARALEVVSNDDIFGAFSATLVASGWGDLNDAGVPSYVWNIHAEESADRQNILGHFPVTCADCTQRGVPWAANDAGATTVASLGYGVSENSRICAQSLEASVNLYGEELGLTMGYLNDNIDFGLPNGIGPEVTLMKDAGVDFIATCMDLNGMKTLAQELERQGMGDVLMYHPNTYNQPFVAESEGLFEGDYVVAQFVPFEYETDIELQQQFLAWMDETGADLSELAMVGWINADLAFEGLLAAGPEFERDTVLAATNSFTAYDAGGLINPIDWTRQHTAPTEGDPTNDYALECLSPVKVESDVFVTVSEPDAPWLCWDNSTTDWAEPTPTNFAD
ncbi:MAG: ABC transporter substrate-binding protein [Acidimicrobiales bacterium]